MRVELEAQTGVLKLLATSGHLAAYEQHGEKIQCRKGDDDAVELPVYTRRDCELPGPFGANDVHVVLLPFPKVALASLAKTKEKMKMGYRTRTG